MPRQRCETELTQIYCRAIWVWGSERSCEQQRQLRLGQIDTPVDGGGYGICHRGPAESVIPSR